MTDKSLNTATIGDVVQMRMGGPRMTVEKIDKYVRCVWFDADNRIQRDAFDACSLNLIVEQPRCGRP